mmetsp:Transcript_14245/g.40892  ORF Transcript_14245/g.40892 Transcript_14245/m.40892 type:complete len:106 (+) Transcript_14245:518-835(+)
MSLLLPNIIRHIHTFLQLDYYDDDDDDDANPAPLPDVGAEEWADGDNDAAAEAVADVVPLTSPPPLSNPSIGMDPAPTPGALRNVAAALRATSSFGKMRLLGRPL